MSNKTSDIWNEITGLKSGLITKLNKSEFEYYKNNSRELVPKNIIQEVLLEDLLPI